MGMFGFTRKAKKFEYLPRYYDERKERLEAMKQKAADPRRAEIEARIRGQFKRARRKNPFMRVGVRFLLILLILLAIVYALAQYYGIPI